MINAERRIKVQWRGEDVDEMDRGELLEIVKHLAQQVEAMRWLLLETNDAYKLEWETNAGRCPYHDAAH